MQKNKKATRNIIVAVAVLIVLVAGFLTAYHFLRQTGKEGAKTIIFSAIVDGTSIKSVEIHTDAEYLRQALEAEGLVEGTESIYGLWVTTVAGRKADDSKEEWWSLYKNGEFSTTGIDDTPLADGDNIEYRLEVGYE